ncbi:MAG: Kazal-type serine protease inhibitor [Myxococcota bacterium]
MSPSLPRAVTALLFGGALASGVGACSSGGSDLACPILMPGGTALMGHGQPLVPAVAPETATPLHGSVGPGMLAAHPIALAAGEKVTITATLADSPALLIAYGPRDVFGGYPACIDLASDGKVTLTAAAQGEWLVLVGRPPGEDAADYSISASCTAGCPAAPACPTLAEQGCADARCDGELQEDPAGCLTCTCAERALCGPDRQAGPGGSCILPACDCPPATADDGPVCGADGNTWPSACRALCAGVAVAVDDACAVACPDLAACSAPCFGLRAIGADGCPTCECLGDFAQNPESCAACPEAAAPVCGSDGVTYRNRCKARCAGARVMVDGACVADQRTWPAGCTLDCAHGLRPVAGTASALACDCAPAPTLSCPTRGAPVCAVLPGVGETTVASACVAVALGATAESSAWGACGIRCDGDHPCPDGLACQASGFLAGRCLAAAAPDCGCAALVDPVCGVDGATWDNACLAHCAGVAVRHEGACCSVDDAPSALECAAPEVATLDPRGCATACGAPATAVCAPDNAITAPACDAAGTGVDGDACAAHFAGHEAWPEACP